ncbi:hypothetical protein [Candidatus Contubernalis alkaliaceticus]|uniref:hypothetical protein n=1 Tax=Candidatus Contubernalis alkaliaceticus TaxID=338645 RepID=UPI001F4BE322|nr:hypothetical protein [Candidatus Contubernalis alkalaceticus]UNC90897.1 hypothetical protein HUE98_01665 [Candidatus Contubernalis alkalaceticus]
MYRDIKIVISMIIYFIYSLSITGAVFFYSLMGTVAMDRLCIIITEATGIQRQERMLSTFLYPAMIQNLFWLSLAGIGFCLIFIFVLNQNFHSFWSPSSLTLLLFLVLMGIRNMLLNFLPDNIDTLVSEPYIINVLHRFLVSNITVLIFGLILCCLAFLGDKFYTHKKESAKT